MRFPKAGYWMAALAAVVAGFASRILLYGVLFEHGRGTAVGRPTLSPLQDTLATLTFRFGFHAMVVFAIVALVVGARSRAREHSARPPATF